MDFCKYKNIFGEPGKGVHKYQFVGMAIVDWVLTISLAAITTLIWTHYSKKKHTWQKTVGYFLTILVILVLLGIFTHWLFCVDTAMNKFIGL